MVAKKLSVVIPCYNEGQGLPDLIHRCADTFQREDVEVVFVDNGSSDDSASIFAELLPAHPNLRSVRVEVNQGYGYGILAGLRAAEGEILSWTHADLQTDPADLNVGLSFFDEVQDVRQCYVKGLRQGRPAIDLAFTVGMSAFETLLLGTRLWDINAQPNMFHRDFYQRWVDDAPHDFSLDLYVYYQAKRHGLAIQRFPVNFDERRFGTSHWNTDLRSKIRFIRRTISYSIKLRRNLNQRRP